MVQEERKLRRKHKEYYMDKKIVSKKKKVARKVDVANLYIKSTFNNTIVSLTDSVGNSLVWSSSGSLGFKGSKKSTPYAASQAAKNVLDKSKDFGIQEINVYVSGVGSGRESAVRALMGSGFKVANIKDVTPVPHNGCRAKKPRRV